MSSGIATLFEYETYRYRSGSRDSFSPETRLLTFTEATLEALDELNAQKRFLEIGRETIRPLNCIGVVKTGDLTIQIFPKLFRGDGYERHKSVIAGNLLTMLAYAEGIATREIDRAGLDEKELDFFEIFMYLFAKNLAVAIKSGQPREYIKRRDDLRFIRERIETRSYTNPARLHIIPCRFHEYSVDTLLNRTLKYTCTLMAKMVRSPETYRLLKSVTGTLDPVTLTPVSVHELDRIAFTRLNRKFEPFIRICRIFLSQSTLTLQASHVETFSLLIPMETLFEEFVAAVLREDPAYFFGREVTVEAQYPAGHLARDGQGRGVFRLRPDIVVQDGAHTAVIDTKYKVLDENKAYRNVQQADMYQMYAYVTKLQAESAMLLYPETEEYAEDRYLFEYVDRSGSAHEVPLAIRRIRLSHDFTMDRGWEAFREELAGVMRGMIPVEDGIKIPRGGTVAVDGL